MGNSVNVQVLPDQDCIYNPDIGKVVQSESLEEHGADYLNFMNELMAMLQEPPPQTESVIKEKVYTEIPVGNPDEFKLRVVLDGAKCQSWGVGDGSDILSVNRHVVVDRVKRKMAVTEYLNKDEPDKKTSESFTFYLENPFRLEGYFVNYDPNTGGTEAGVRKSDEDAVAIWSGYTNAICNIIVNTKVKCKFDQPSLDGSGDLVIVSDRLDEFVAEESFWASILSCTKEGILATSPDATIVETTEGVVQTMEVTTEVDDPVTPSAKLQFKQTITLDSDKKQCKTEAFATGKHFSTSFISMVHWPHVESYRVMADGGERQSGKYYAREFGQQINSILKKAEAGSSILGAIGLGGLFG